MLASMRRIALSLGILLSGCEEDPADSMEHDVVMQDEAEQTCMELYQLYTNVCDDYLRPSDWDTPEANECFGDVWLDAEMEPTYHQLAWQAASTCDRAGHPLCAQKLDACQSASR